MKTNNYEPLTLNFESDTSPIQKCAAYSGVIRTAQVLLGAMENIETKAIQGHKAKELYADLDKAILPIWDQIIRLSNFEGFCHLNKINQTALMYITSQSGVFDYFETFLNRVYIRTNQVSPLSQVAYAKKGKKLRSHILEICEGLRKIALSSIAGAYNANVMWAQYRLNECHDYRKAVVEYTELMFFDKSIADTVADIALPTEDNESKLPDLSIADANLSQRVKSMLIGHDITTAEKLAEQRQVDLYLISGFGKAAWRETRNFLDNVNLL